MSGKEKKSCQFCAYLHRVAIASVSGYNAQRSCIANNCSISGQELSIKSCKKFLRRKEGMTLEQQIEEQKQEQRQKQEAEEQARLKKEHDRLRNRLRRNWYYVSALLIGIIGLIIAIWRLLLNN
jgi:actin-related protein